MRLLSLIYAIAAATHVAGAALGTVLRRKLADNSIVDANEDTQIAGRSTVPAVRRSKPFKRPNSRMRGRLPNMHKRLAAADDTMATDRYCGAFQSTSPLSGNEVASPDIYDGSVTFFGVTGQFNVPELSMRPWQRSANTSFPELYPTLVTYVSIDGLWCPEPLAAGVMSSIKFNGTQTHEVFFAAPGQSDIETVDLLPVSGGNSVRMTIERQSDYLALISMQNLSTNQTVRQRVRTDGVCGSTVSWLVEDITGGSLDPVYPYHKGAYFPAFKPVRFTNLDAVKTDRRKTSLEGAMLTDYEAVVEDGGSGLVLCRGTRSADGSLLVTSG